MNKYNWNSYIDTGMTLNTAYTIPVDSLLCLSIKVQSQTDCRVTARIVNSGTATTDSPMFADWLHNGGTAERNTSPVTIPVKAGNSIYLEKQGGSTAEVVIARIFKVS